MSTIIVPYTPKTGVCNYYDIWFILCCKLTRILKVYGGEVWNK